MTASPARPRQTVRTQRLASRRGRPDSAKPRKALSTAVANLFNDGFGPHNLIVAYVDGHGDTYVVAGLACAILATNGRNHLLFDDGLQVPLDSLTAVGMNLMPL